MSEFKMTVETYIKSPETVIKWEKGEKPSEFTKRLLAASKGAD